MAGVDSAAARRRQRRLRQFLRHERLSVAIALAESQHHTSRGQKMARAGEEGHEEHNALRRQKPLLPRRSSTMRRTRKGGAAPLFLRTSQLKTSCWERGNRSRRSCVHQTNRQWLVQRREVLRRASRGNGDSNSDAGACKTGSWEVSFEGDDPRDQQRRDHAEVADDLWGPHT